MCSIIGVGERLHKVLGQIDLGTLDSGEQSLPFGLLVHYFGEIIAIGLRQDMVDETVGSILVKEGRVEITFLFHSNC